MKFLSSLFGPKRKTLGGAVFNAPLRPAFGFVCVGDVHGCDSQLEIVLERARSAWPEAPVVFVGDYVDRGEGSQTVLRRLHDLATKSEDQIICLMGNHERMLLDFLNEPMRAGSRWMQHGGLQTLSSFGLGFPGKDLEACAKALERAMGEALIEWLRALPLSWHSGNVWVVHAGADPNVPMPEQTADVLLWGHLDFDRVPRADGNWVVHGHTIVDQPSAAQGRVSIDTGAFATGRLSGVYIDKEGFEFFCP